MPTKIQKLEREIQTIKQRNARVEADKAWERSSFRIFSITALTYLVAVALLYVIGVENFILTALVPAIGYYLSMQSLPAIKNWWVKKHF